jgi:sodium/potassium-transporting ATPase subunit alpha
MGEGNDVAKEAADIIFMDNDFCSLINGIKEGRILFDNLKKSCTYTISHCVPEIMPILANLALGLP